MLCAACSILNREHRFMSPRVLFEDVEILAIDKPPGMPSVSLRNGEKGTAAAWALQTRPELAHVNPAKPLEAGLVHRLDTGTSGVLVFARTPSALARLRGLWTTGEVRKTYLAVVDSAKEPHPALGLPSGFPAQGIPVRITHPLAAHPKSAKRMVLALPDRFRGRALDAETEILSAQALAKSGFLLTIAIRTGVRHQIRVHLATAGTPIRGDRVYGGMEHSRLGLHAWRIEIPGKPAIEAPSRLLGVPIGFVGFGDP